MYRLDSKDLSVLLMKFLRYINESKAKFTGKKDFRIDSWDWKTNSSYRHIREGEYIFYNNKK